MQGKVAKLSNIDIVGTSTPYVLYLGSLGKPARYVGGRHNQLGILNIAKHVGTGVTHGAAQRTTEAFGNDTLRYRGM